MKFKIANEVDALGEEVEVFHSDRISQELPVCSMYLKATTYLIDKGWAMAPFGLISNSHKVIWVQRKSDGVPMGGVVYEYHPQNKQGWIVLIFTEEEFKGRRIYSILQKYLEEITVILGGTSIASMAHKDNEARLKAGEREGMTPQFLRLYKDLSPGLEERKQQISSRRNKPWDDLNADRWYVAPTN